MERNRQAQLHQIHLYKQNEQIKEGAFAAETILYKQNNTAESYNAEPTEKIPY
jgi:hypothetical protein